MKLLMLIKTAYRSLMKNKMRSFLTMSGVIIGVAAVIVLVSIGKGAEKQIKDRIMSMGVNLIIVNSSFGQQTSTRNVSQRTQAFSRLSVNDIVAIKKKANYLAGVSPFLRTTTTVYYGSENLNTTIVGVSEDYSIIRAWNVSNGRFLEQSDVSRNLRNAVLGAYVAEMLFHNEDPIGKKIRINNLQFEVIGILEKKGETMSGNQDDIIMIPYTTYQSRIGRNNFINQILCSAINEESIPLAITEISNVLRETHRLKNNDADDFSIRNQADILSTSQEITATLTIFLGAIAGISLFVGGIGIMNIMLVSVTERTREIGIRMAIGAKGRDILFQFLIESVFLSVCGGIIGIVIGIIIGNFSTRFTNLPVSFPLETILLAFTFSVIVGIFFGIYPASKASNLDPIESLRYE